VTRTVVHLLRHGEVDNPRHIMYGRLPGYRLSDAGREMAQRAAAVLLGRDVTYVVSSPLERARETAEPVARAYGIEVHVDDRLIEAANAFEGQPFGPGDRALLHPRAWPLLRNPFRPSWGEPYLVIAQRMLAAVTGARTSAEGHEVVCVTHQLPIWTLRRYLEGGRLWHNPRHRQCSLGSLTSLTFDGERAVQLRYTEPAGPEPAGTIPGA
jgi:broad specificity phosphatase PhoE